MSDAERKRVTNQLRSNAQQLRRDATSPEHLLWSILRAKQIGGFKFRRQVPIDSYVVDFYCPRAQLVVEVDGESHEGKEAYDAARQHRLEELGLRVFRCNNDDVLTNLDGVAEAVLMACRQGGATP
ncbi:MAG: DUF559 domain-containing protein, partial [Planctomycetota bacterium]